MKIVVDGTEFNGLENLPPEARARYEEAIRQLDANRNGIPDLLEGRMGRGNSSTRAAAGGGGTAARRAPAFARGLAAAPDTTTGWMLVLTGLFILLACAAGAAGIWYLFLR
jgi:hypothetical protein